MHTPQPGEARRLGVHSQTQSYLVRLWPVDDGSGAGWRVWLQSVRTGEQHVFADLESLLVFLCDQTQA